MSRPLSRAWSWSVEKSPLLNISRWIIHRGYTNTQVRAEIDAAQLPSELAELIDSTIKRTKLWRSERAEIALELITHTQDALESGKGTEEIIRSFGNHKKVAKLLRRSTKRKRPLYWRTLRNMRRAIGAVFVLFFVVYSIQLVRYLSGQPTIKTNYIQLINSYNEAYTEDEKAWPIYNQINIAWKEFSTPIRDQQYEEERAYNDSRALLDEDDAEMMSAGFFMIPHVPLDHPHYEQTAQLIRDFAPELDRLRKACHRPIIGIDAGFDLEITPPDGNPYDVKMAAPQSDVDRQPTLVEMLLPHLGMMRMFSNLMYFDALVAARDGDHQRVYENLSAMLAIARQKSFDGTVIADLVHIAIAELTNNAMKQVIAEHPGILSREHLVALSHELALVRPTLHISFNGERMMFDDVLQRTYTDDGDGNGRLTKHGSQILFEFSGSFSPNDPSVDPIQIITGPFALTIASDRKTQHDTYHRMMDQVEFVQEKGPQFIAILDHQEITLGRNSGSVMGMPVAPIEILMPALSSAVSRTFLSHTTHSASAVMLALEIYHIDHGRYPPTLSQILPRYLPEIPEDSFNPGHRLNYIASTNTYTLYSVGSDGDDDGAKRVEEARRSPSFGDRFPPQFTNRGVLFEDNGLPVILDPRGPDGDWILIEIDRASQTQEPDQSPALESIN
jgi:hypothetical protein